MTDTARLRGRFLLAMGALVVGCTKDATPDPNTNANANTVNTANTNTSARGSMPLPPEPGCMVCALQCEQATGTGPYPTPFERCAPTIEGGQGLFSVEQTKRTRGDATTASTCCYVFPNRHPPGPGRPYVVDGRARVADAKTRGDWTQPIRPIVPNDPAERRAREDTWRKAGLAEHASIASFARFALELLALGAPPELLHDAHAAAMDEVKHARLAFALASAYAGEPLGPGPLRTVDAPPRASLEDVALATLVEGGLGETVAALEARMDAARSEDPVVRAILLEIADDEERHAELAWRTLAWAVREGGAALAHALADAVRDLERAGGDPTRSRVLRDIVGPCVAALAAA